MGGWKTWLAALIVALAAGLEALGYTDAAKAVFMLASAFGLVGIGHKIEKTLGK